MSALPVILDDVGPAIAALTSYGAAVVAAGALEVRRRVLDFAARRGWTVVSYGRYVEWMGGFLGSKTSVPAVLLDPLFREATVHSTSLLPLRLRRDADLARYDLAEPAPWYVERGFSGSVIVIDDAAASGGSLAFAGNMVAFAGGAPIAFYVAASTHMARRRIQQKFPTSTWNQFHQADSNVCHLRDGCPWLPYTGRSSSRLPVLCADGGTIELRRSMDEATNNLWQVLLLDRAIRHAVEEAHAATFSRLESDLRRPPVVTDVRLLGVNVPIVLGGHAPLGVTERTPLRQVVA